MKKFIHVFVFSFLALFAIAVFSVPLAAAEGDTTITFTYDPAVVTGILGLFGIGLVYVTNGLKSLFKIQGKAAVALTIIVSVAATAGTLAVAHGLAVLPLIVYSAAVVGEMTGWYKFTKPTA
ncbi:MAG: hypothetical protein ACYDH3_00075 [Candidatus Aminicenantales bacterium]